MGNLHSYVKSVYIKYEKSILVYKRIITSVRAGCVQCIGVVAGVQGLGS